MTGKLTKNLRVLAIAPFTRGFGFAVLDDGGEKLVEWGVKSFKRNKNAQCLMNVNEMINHHQPGVLVLEDVSAEGSTSLGENSETQRPNSWRRPQAASFGSQHFPARSGDKSSSMTAKEQSRKLLKSLPNGFRKELGSILPPKTGVLSAGKLSDARL